MQNIAVFSITFLALAVTGQGQQICPPAESLTPCTCNEADRKIECRDVRGRFDIKGIFENASQFVDDSFVFSELAIFECTPLLEIPSGGFGSLKFEKLDFMYNRNLYHISPNAFSPEAKREIRRIDLWNNLLEDDLFEFLNEFENLEIMWSPSNYLTKLPVLNLPNLRQLYLGSNSIKEIADRALAQSPNLTDLWLSHNDILAEGSVSSLGFEGISTQVDVDLTYNTEMTYVNQTNFQSLLDRAKQVTVGGSHCNVNGCTFRRLNCDSRADWICEKRAEYEGKVSGFRCLEQGLDNIWQYCDSIGKQRNI